MNEILERVIAANAASHRRNPGDYVQDGLLHCGVCREPKQLRLTNLPPGVRPFTPYIDCRCEREQKEREERERSEAARKRRIEENRADCFQSPAQAAFTFGKDDGANPALTRLAKRYCEKFDEIRRRETQRGLLLFGPPGTGKSFMACAVCNALLEQGRRCRVTSLPQIVNELRIADDKNACLAALQRYDLLVLDDFGTQRSTAFMNEQVFEIVNALSLARAPLIATTNLTAAELKEPDDTANARVISRLFELCHPFEVKGKDRRKATLLRGEH